LLNVYKEVCLIMFKGMYRYRGMGYSYGNEGVAICAGWGFLVKS